MSSTYMFARGGRALSRWIPSTVRHGIGSAIGAGSYLGWRSKRLVTQQNMAHVAGRPVRDPYVRHLAFASWCNYGRYAADFIHFPNVNAEAIERNGRDLSEGVERWQEYLEAALKPGRGVILVTAHFGNWDIAGAIMTRYAPLSAVVETFSDERWNALLQNTRKEKGINLIPMEGSARRILRVLQQNQIVAIVIDRPVAAEQGTAISFFGHTTYVPGGPAALALKNGAAIMSGYVWYGEHNRFYIRAFPPIFPVEVKGDERAGEVARLTQCMYDNLEEMVRGYPTQWYMFRPFWPAQ